MLKLFSGSSAQHLTTKTAEVLKIPISKAEVVTFKNTEVRVRIEEPVKDDVCVVIQSTSAPTNDNLMELFFFCDALARQEADKVIGVIPYFGYARQDIQHRDGECLSANVVIRFLESIGFDKIYVFDLHDEATEGVFSIPFKNVTAMPLLAKEILAYLKVDKPDPTQFAIVSPDQGGIERARKFGQHFFGHEFFSVHVIEKKRDQNVIHHTTALNLYGDVAGKTAILIDDIVTSGRTLINATNLCLEHKAKRVLASIVHHEFSKDTIQKIIDSPIEKIFSTDTIPLSPDLRFDKLVEVSITPLIAKELASFMS